MRFFGADILGGACVVMNQSRASNASAFSVRRANSFAFNSSRPTPHLTMKTELCFALNPSQCHIHLGKPTESAGISHHLCACSHGSAVALCHCDATVRPLLCLFEKLEATILPLSDFDNACGKQAPQAYIRRPRHLWILQLFNSPAFESCSS